VFSFHGIPENQCTRTDETGSICMKLPDCCSQGGDATRNCYRSQCMATAELLGRSADLPDGSWSVSFQSRAALRTAITWTRPFTDELLVELARKGKRRVAVCFPSYTADCIETLGEIGHECRELFLAAGGCELRLVPCVNSSDAWVRGLARLVAASVTPHEGEEDHEGGDTNTRVGGFWAM
jgi:ferrochelatase